MTPGQIVLLVVVPLALAFGLWRAFSDGRFRGTRRVRNRPSGQGPAAQGQAGPGQSGLAKSEQEESMNVLDGSGIDHELGEKATLLQFSSAFCAPCRATRRVLGDIADVVPGVTHVEVDAELHLALVRRLGVARTPTTLILDAEGREMNRASGAPRKEQVLGALAAMA